jgi:hypothetical protein
LIVDKNKKNDLNIPFKGWLEKLKNGNNEVRVRVTDRAIVRFRGRGLFRGRVRVRFIARIRIIVRVRVIGLVYYERVRVRGRVRVRFRVSVRIRVMVLSITSRVFIVRVFHP